MLEKQLETQILSWLNFQKDVFAFKVNTTGIYDTRKKVFRTIKNPYIWKGTPDILGVLKGRFFGIEVKTPAGLKKAISSPTTRDYNQIAFVQKIRDYGGHAIRISSLDEVISFICTLKELYKAS